MPEANYTSSVASFIPSVPETIPGSTVTQASPEKRAATVLAYSLLRERPVPPMPPRSAVPGVHRFRQPYPQPPPRQFAAIKYRLQHARGFRRQHANTNLFFSPKQNARPQPVRLHKTLHKIHLIDADAQKESRELNQRFFAGCAT
jgi:hypothetical protein